VSKSVMKRLVVQSPDVRELVDQRDRLVKALGDVTALAAAAMRLANYDGAEYDIDGELQDARALLAEVEASRG